MTRVILLPGLACDAALWRDQLAALATRGDVHVSDVHARFATLPEMAQGLLEDHPGELVLAGTSMGGQAGAGQLIRQNRAVMARADSRPLLPGLRCPTLVVCGEADLLTPPDCAREMADAIPGAQLRVLPQCGHLLTWEQPEAVNALLCDWLARLDSGAAGLHR